MKQSKKRPGRKGKSWSIRSQQSWVKQHELEEKLTKCRSLISSCERDIAEAKKGSERQVGQVVGGSGPATVILGEHLAELEDKKRKLAAYKEHAVSLQRETHALTHPRPSLLAHRRKQQTLLAGLAAERLVKDRLAERALRSLRSLLEERARLSATMQEVARTIEFTGEPDGFDEQRFDALLNSLPNGLAAESEKWISWFLGEEPTEESYTVTQEVLLFPETLASAHFYRYGDRLELTEAQAGKLASEREAEDALYRQRQADAELNFPRPQSPEAEKRPLLSGDGIIGP
jgi:hypothetical protein